MKKTLTSIAIAMVATMLLIGCAPTNSEPAGYKKDDFAKTDPPPGWGAGGGSTGGAAAPAAKPEDGKASAPATGQ